MRTTVDLPEELHRIVSSLAVHTRRSISATTVELIQRGLGIAEAAPARGVSIDAKTGLPTVRLPRPVTADDVKSLDDDE